MRKWIGIVCIILGAICLLTAVGFVIYNQWEAENAAGITRSLLEDIQLAIDGNKISDQPQNSVPDDNLPGSGNMPSEMATIQVDGYDCIGVLSIPPLGLDLPVLTEWSYAKLKKAPCLYYGSYYEDDFVIAAHNYDAHFGRLSELQSGDIVIFTDVHGAEHFYEVILLETLPPTATEEMITSGFDLSLYTCTPGGGNRVTVRCNFKIANSS